MNHPAGLLPGVGKGPETRSTPSEECVGQRIFSTQLLRVTTFANMPELGRHEGIVSRLTARD